MKMSWNTTHIDSDQPNIKTRAFPFPKKLRTVAAAKDQSKGGPRCCQRPGPAPIPCGLPPCLSHEAFHTILSAVETDAASNAAYTRYRLQLGSGTWARLKANQEKNKSDHGSKNK